MKTSHDLHRTMPARQKGLTLIELLITFLIISIISMISVPIYQNYRLRTKLGGEFMLVRPLIALVNEHFAIEGQWPADNAEANARAPELFKGNYLLSATISDSPQAASITLVFDTEKLPVLRGSNTIVYYPESNGGGTKWHCDQGTIPDKYRPPSCR